MNAPVQVCSGAYLLVGEVGGRPLYLPLLIGEECSLLADTGCASDVEKVILPSMQRIGFSPSSLSLILNTHCDVDHIGGNYGVKQIAPQALLCCGDADREQIESAGAIYRQRYNAFREDHDHYYDRVTQAWIASELGRDQPVALTFKGGERIRLSPSWHLELLHLPGHSLGHLGILDYQNRVLFAGDAIQGAYLPDIAGRPAVPPSYMYVDLYLQTISAIERLNLDVLSGCHWPIKHAGEIRAFCSESREFVHMAESLILKALGNGKAGRTLKELCFEIGPLLGRWPEAANHELCYAVSGHLCELLNRRQIERISEARPFRYRIANT